MYSQAAFSTSRSWGLSGIAPTGVLEESQVPSRKESTVPTEPCSRHLHGLQELIHDTAQNDTFMSRRGGGAHVVGGLWAALLLRKP